MLGVAFLVKSGAWPLNFWLPTTYSAAAAPVAAIFSVMTKVGVYIILRLSSLLSATDGAFELFGASWLLFGGIGTILFATFGVLSTRHVPRIAGYATIISINPPSSAAAKRSSPPHYLWSLGWRRVLRDDNQRERRRPPTRTGPIFLTMKRRPQRVRRRGG